MQRKKQPKADDAVQQREPATPRRKSGERQGVAPKDAARRWKNSFSDPGKTASRILISLIVATHCISAQGSIKFQRTITPTDHQSFVVANLADNVVNNKQNARINVPS